LLPEIRRVLVAVALDRVLKSDLEHFLFGPRDIKRAVLLAGIEPAIGKNAALCCGHAGSPFVGV
jgi:hypothetical protein